MGHTDMIGQIDQVQGFIQKWNYPNQQSTLEAEWGTVANIRFLLSSIGSISPNASLLGNNVYNLFTAGRESYCAIEQDGYSASFIYRPPIFDGPLALNASCGWKMAETPRLLNDEWIFNMRCTLA
jgi:N4-gp56 family major capsid protein